MLSFYYFWTPPPLFPRSDRGRFKTLTSADVFEGWLGQEVELGQMYCEHVGIRCWTTRDGDVDVIDFGKGSGEVLSVDPNANRGLGWKVMFGLKAKFQEVVGCIRKLWNIWVIWHWNFYFNNDFADSQWLYQTCHKVVASHTLHQKLGPKI